jgi:hypothetical protein
MEQYLSYRPRTSDQATVFALRPKKADVQMESLFTLPVRLTLHVITEFQDGYVCKSTSTVGLFTSRKDEMIAFTCAIVNYSVGKPQG